MKKVLIYVIIGVAVGFVLGKQFYEVPVTAGMCIDAGTQSISMKFDKVMSIIKQ